VLSLESHTAAAKVIKANTRVIKGDQFKLAGYVAPLALSVGAIPGSSQTGQMDAADVVSSKLKIQDASGQSRLNLGDLAKFLHYDSGDAAIKAENYKMLDQLIEYLRTSGDLRMIRIEGHTDNVEIGPSLKSRYPSNWELSKVRANGVLRYLVEKGGVTPERISAVGLGDTKPTAPNAAEDGRTKNRRVEILLYTREMDAPALQPGAQRLEHSPSRLSAHGSDDPPLPSTAASDAADSSARGTLSIGDSSQVSVKDESGAVSNSDSNGVPPTATNNTSNTSPQQPTIGTPAE
jgi:chemotaxis protein MotB